MDVIQTAHKLTYSRNVQLAIQQKKSRFEQAFTYQDALKGRVHMMIELMGPAAAIIDGVRGGDTPDIDSNIEPVWVVPHQIEWGKLIEKEDAIKALTDYQGPFTQVGAAAIVRGRDQVFANAIFGNRLIGQDATTSAAWDSTNKVVAVDLVLPGTPAGMTVKKIQRAKRFLRAQYLDLDTEELWGVLNAQGHEELYNDLLTINIDTAKMEYVADDAQKLVHRVAGVNFVQYESVPDFDANTYTGAIWVKSGMYYGDFDPLTITVERNPQKKYRWHPFMENWWGATRSEDGRVIKILNKK